MTDGFVAGIVVGIIVGMLFGPVLRSYLVWREWKRASQPAELIDEIIERMAPARGPDPAKAKASGRRAAR